VGDDPRTGDVISSTVSYESGVAATIDFRRPGASARPGGRGDAPGELDGLPGRILGDFVLGDVLGRGGCGTVYRAEQRTLDRPAVVKVLHRSPATRRDLAERFVREARLASRFDHPYAAHVYAFGVEPDGIMWIAMELVDGTPLGRLVKQSGPLALDQFVPLFERLCEVVQSAHDQGIVHRDIKPSNVMVIARRRPATPRTRRGRSGRSRSRTSPRWPPRTPAPR
jgi:serine/threonine protein kinase